MVKNLYYIPRGTAHYNIHFKGGSLRNRVKERALSGLRAQDIEWVWIVELRRRATPEEVEKLCVLSYER